MHLTANKPLNRLNSLLLPSFIAVLLIFCILILKLPKPPNNPQFRLTPIDKSSSKIIFSSYFIPQPQFLLSAHSATFEVLPNGNLIALWFAGSHEGKPDVKIWQSYFNGKAWTKAQDVISPAKISKNTNLYIKKVGNPVVYKAINGRLHLFVVSVSIGGWSGSSLNHYVSDDLGNTWHSGHKLILSPFMNLSTLNRTRAISLVDGGFYLPVYHEFIRTYAEVLRFDKDGNFIQQIRLTNYNNLLQPAMLVTTPDHAFMFMRNNYRRNNNLYYQETNDGGLTWTKPEITNLTNEDSSLVVAQIGISKYLMVHNIDKRSKLSLAVSNDGTSWKDMVLLENVLGEEFSYPAIQVHDGLVDILYTWERKYIKHVRFNLNWLDQKILLQGNSVE